MEILGGHVLDLVQYLLGPIRDLSARTAIRSPEHRAAETGEPITVTAADHFLATAELDGGALVSLHLRDGEAVAPRTRIEIAGTEGSLVLASAPGADPWAAQPQIDKLELYEAQPDSPIWTKAPTDHTNGLPLQAANVARLYDQLATDLGDGSRITPDFHAAHELHRLIETSLARR